MTRRDDGFGLLEVVVSMALTGVAGAVFTTAVVQIYRTSGANESRSIAQSQVSQALLRLDREVRYASYVGATSPARPYVEYLLQGGCVQLRLANGQLQRRTWNPGGTPTPTAWQAIASQVASTAPFTRLDPAGALAHQQLTVDLIATDGGVSKHSTITFTALNTDQNTAATADPCDDPGTRS